LRDKDAAPFTDRIVQVVPVFSLDTVDKHGHMAPQASLIVEQIAAEPWIDPAYMLKHRAQRPAGHLHGGASQMTCKVGSEFNTHHDGYDTPRNSGSLAIVLLYRLE
jgi:hypothetical protein